MRVCFTRSLLGCFFNSYTNSDNRSKPTRQGVVYVGDNSFEDGFNGAYYIHQYTFENQFFLFGKDEDSDEYSDINDLGDTRALNSLQIDRYNEFDTKIRQITVDMQE